MRDMAEPIGALVIAVAIVAAVIGGLHACAESRRRSFRRDCESRGAAVIEVLGPDGATALVCQPPGGSGGTIAIPARGRQWMPRHR